MKGRLDQFLLADKKLKFTKDTIIVSLFSTSSKNLISMIAFKSISYADNHFFKILIV